MPDAVVQLLGLTVLIVPFIAIQWNLAGRQRASPRLLAPRPQQRWRLELYSNRPGVEGAIVNRSDIPFPVKQVRSARGDLAKRSPDRAWALPQVELDVLVDDPFTDDVLSGLFGVGHHVRFVTGNEAVVDARTDLRVRVRALPYGQEDPP